MKSEKDRYALPDSALDRAARAIWDSQRKSEIKQIERFEFDSGLFSQSTKIILVSNKGMSIIAGWALISKCLEAGIKFHLSHGSKKEQKEFLQGFGPLATDSSRLRFALLMGWISNNERDILNYVRKSRNEIAHGIIPDEDLAFPDEMAVDHRKKLDETIDRMMDAAREVDGENAFGKNISSSKRWRTYFHLLANDVLESIVCGPGRQRLGIGEPHKVFFNRDDAPSWVNENRKAVARAVLTIGANAEI